jgi:hypothetical protein
MSDPVNQYEVERVLLADAGNVADLFSKADELIAGAYRAKARSVAYSSRSSSR